MRHATASPCTLGRWDRDDCGLTVRQWLERETEMAAMVRQRTAKLAVGTYTIRPDGRARGAPKDGA